MFFKRFYDENLAQASYLIACEKTREAIVIDPNLDVSQYTRAAGAQHAPQGSCIDRGEAGGHGAPIAMRRRRVNKRQCGAAGSKARRSRP